jgi:lipopolysaccharide assembly outer membrane protein LptD (OstA)
MTSEQQLAFEGFIDIMVQIYKMTSDKIDYSKLEKNKDWVKERS